MKITKKTIYSVDDFTLTFDPIEDSIIIKKTKKGYEIRYLIQDEGDYNPFKDEEGNGNFFHWNNGREELLKYCNALGYDPDTREKINKSNPDSVKIDKFEHGQIYYSISGEGTQCRFDTSSNWAVWLPDNVLLDEAKRLKGIKRHEKMVEWAKQACELFNQWANGDVYCIVKEVYNNDKKQLDYENVGGYFGYDNALKYLKTDI